MLARRVNEAIAREGIAAMADYLADDVVWHEIERSEPRHGKARLAVGMGDMDYEIACEAHDILGNDEHVIILGDARGTRAGRTLDYRVAEIHGSAAHAPYQGLVSRAGQPHNAVRPRLQRFGGDSWVTRDQAARAA